MVFKTKPLIGLNPHDCYVIDPHLFLLYINDIKSVTQDAYCLLYADDSFKRCIQTSLIASLQRGLRTVDHWLSINKMTIN